MSDQPTQPQSEPEKSKVVPLRALVINLLFSMFTSFVIFAVASYYFLVPQMYRQKTELDAVKAQIQELDQRTTTDETAQAEPDEEAAAGDAETVQAAAPAAADGVASAAGEAAAPAAGQEAALAAGEEAAPAAAPAAAAAATP